MVALKAFFRSWGVAGDVLGRLEIVVETNGGKNAVDAEEGSYRTVAKGVVGFEFLSVG